MVFKIINRVQICTQTKRLLAFLKLSVMLDAFTLPSVTQYVGFAGKRGPEDESRTNTLRRQIQQAILSKFASQRDPSSANIRQAFAEYDRER